MKINGLKMLPVLLMMIMTMLVGSASAQWWNPQYPNSGISRFRWEGIVDGTTFIYIQGRQVRVETRSGLPVQRQRYNFSDPLPRASVQLGLEVFNGRGRVRLAETPRASNGFTAVVRIEDNSGGRDTYGFELQWNDRTPRDNGGGSPGPRNSEGVTWRGRVDGESILRFRGERAWDETISGTGVSNARANFSAPLPRRQVTVNLINNDGRGDVVLLEQPTRNNDYTAAVRVRDRWGGPGNYNFTLSWEQSRPRDDDDDWPFPGGGNNVRGLRWSGMVDGRDLIYIRGSQLWIDHREGQPIYGDNHRFFQPLPSNGRANIFVRKLNGRGSVRVIEQPSRNNNFTAVLQVEDRDGGADRYEFEVIW